MRRFLTALLCAFLVATQAFAGTTYGNGSGVGDWNSLANIPAGFSDNQDNTGGSVPTLSASDPINGTTACATVGELFYQTSRKQLWRCTAITPTNTWEKITFLGTSTACLNAINNVVVIDQNCDGTFAPNSGDIPLNPSGYDAIVDVTGLTSKQTLQTLAASLRPYLTNPQTDTDRNVYWIGSATVLSTDCKPYGTSTMTRKCIMFAPVGALDSGGSYDQLPALDCTKNVAGGYLRVHSQGMVLTLDETAQDKFTQLVSVGAGDVCGFTSNLTTSAGSTGGMNNWLKFDGQLTLQTANPPLGSWTLGRPPYIAAITGASTTGDVLLGMYNSSGSDFDNLTLHLNCGSGLGVANPDSVGWASTDSFGANFPKGRIGSCGAGAVLMPYGGHLYQSGMHISNNAVGVIDFNQQGSGVQVAADCVNLSLCTSPGAPQACCTGAGTGNCCSNTRASPTALEGYQNNLVAGWVIEGNTVDIATATGGWDFSTSYNEGTSSIGQIYLGAGTCSGAGAAPCTAAGVLCCKDPDSNPATTPNCIDLHGSNPTDYTDSYVGVFRWDGTNNGNFCFGPATHYGSLEQANVVISGAFTGGGVGIFTTTSGGYGNQTCTANVTPWPCCTGNGTGTCRGPTVDTQHLNDANSWGTITPPSGFTGRWISTKAYGRQAIRSVWSAIASTDNLLLENMVTKYIPQSLKCVAYGGSSLTRVDITIDECDTNGSSCVSTGGTVSMTTTGSTQTDATFTNNLFTSGNWLRASVSNLTWATPGYVSCTLNVLPTE